MLDPKYIPLFIGGFIAWIVIMILVGYFTSRGKNKGSDFRRFESRLFPDFLHGRRYHDRYRQRHWEKKM